MSADRTTTRRPLRARIVGPKFLCGELLGKIFENSERFPNPLVAVHKHRYLAGRRILQDFFAQVVWDGDGAAAAEIGHDQHYLAANTI